MSERKKVVKSGVFNFHEKSAHAPDGDFLWGGYEVFYKGSLIAMLDVNCLPKVPIIFVFRKTSSHAVGGVADMSAFDWPTDIEIVGSFCSAPELPYRAQMEDLVLRQRWQAAIDDALAAKDWALVSELCGQENYDRGGLADDTEVS